MLVSLAAEVDNERGVWGLCFVEMKVYARVVDALVPSCTALTLASPEYKDVWPGSRLVLLAETAPMSELEFSVCPDSLTMSSTCVFVFSAAFEATSSLVVLNVVGTKSASLALCGLCMELPPVRLALTSRFSKPRSLCLPVDVVQLEVDHRLVEGEGVMITGVDVMMIVGMYVLQMPMI